MSKKECGIATAKKMTPAERKARAMKGVEARKYKAQLPRSRFEGKLPIGGNELDVAVIDGEIRVIKQTAVFEALDRPARGNSRIKNTPTFMDAKNLQPFITEELKGVMQKIEYVDQRGNIQSGYDANILPLVANLYLKAREAGQLHNTQVDTARKAEILVRGLAQVGITSLVDEATGFQAERDKNALAEIFERFVAKELQPWIKTFPDEYYVQLFRLYKLDYPPKGGSVKRPSFFGHVTNKVVYNKLAPEILPELKRQADKLGTRGTKLHQTLTPNDGHPKLREHLSSIITIMKLAKDKESFFEMVDKIHPDFENRYLGSDENDN